MTQQQNDNIRRLLKLALLSQEFELVDIKLVDQWCALREELGLSKLLLLIEEYVKSKAQIYTATDYPPTTPPQITNPDQNLNVVQ